MSTFSVATHRRPPGAGHARSVALATLICALALGACSSGSPAPTGGAAPGTSAAGGGATAAAPPPAGAPATPKFPLLTYQLTLTGAVPLTGNVTSLVTLEIPLTGGDERPATCSEVNGGSFSGKVGGHDVSLDLTLDDASPGTRPIGSSGGGLAIDQGEDTNFSPQDAPQSTITIGTDGSGSLQLISWESATAKLESGTISWTCS